MTEEIIKDWISSFSRMGLEELDIQSGSEICSDELAIALFEYFRDFNTVGDVNAIDVCGLLFKYYRSTEQQLRMFSLQFLPQILYLYLNAISRCDKKNSRMLEAFIIGIYNMEVVDENGQSKVISFRLPSLAQPSLYHEPVSLAPASLTESALKRLEQRDSQLVRWGPLQPVDKLLPQNRLNVLTELLFCYNRYIPVIPKISLQHLCKTVTRLVTQGFLKSNTDSFDEQTICPRIPLSTSFLCQLLHSLYHAMVNGHKREALQAIQDITERANYQGMTQVLLLSNAMLNYAYSALSEPADTVFGVAGHIKGRSTAPLSKSMITNASFRTKKLPDDIPIQEVNTRTEDTSLGAISEEKEGSSTPEIHARKSLPKMAANFGKRTKEKIAIAVKSGSITRSLSKANGISGNEQWDTDESGIELGGSDLSNLANNSEHEGNANKRTMQHNEVNRSIQLTSV